jgi:hypothetical protein
MKQSQTSLNRKIYALIAVLLCIFLFIFLSGNKETAETAKIVPQPEEELEEATEEIAEEKEKEKEKEAEEIESSTSTIVVADPADRMDYFLFKGPKYGFLKDGLFMLWTNSQPNAMNDNIKNDEYLNNHLMKLIENLIKNNNNIYFSDIGANMGIFAFFTLKYCEKYSKNCYLNLYEAQPKLAKVIMKTLLFNNFDSQVTLNNCLLDFVGAHKLCHSPGNQGRTRIMDDAEIAKLYAPDQEFRFCEKVYGCKYTDNSEKLNKPNDDDKICRFTKIDIEGHDLVFLMKHSLDFMENDIVFFEYFGDLKKTGPDELQQFVAIFEEEFDIYIGSSLVTKKNVANFKKFSPDNMIKNKHPRCAS